MKTVKIGKLLLEPGKVKIAVSVMGRQEEDVLSDAVLAQSEKPDIVEWRADLLWEKYNAAKEGFGGLSVVKNTAKRLRVFLEDTPLLFTIRTKNEGGMAELSLDEYEKVIRDIAAGGLADAADVEIFRFSGQEERLGRLVEDLKKYKVKVIMSSHDFEKTPPLEEMIKRFEIMEASGADLAKIAVMPKDRQDVMDLMNATFLADQALDIPLISMSMGDLGKTSRIAGSITGSCLSFASKGKASAPGQIYIGKLRGVL